MKIKVFGFNLCVGTVVFSVLVGWILGAFFTPYNMTGESFENNDRVSEENACTQKNKEELDHCESSATDENDKKCKSSANSDSKKCFNKVKEKYGEINIDKKDKKNCAQIQKDKMKGCNTLSPSGFAECRDKAHDDKLTCIQNAYK